MDGNNHAAPTENLCRALHPRWFSGMSGKMAAIVGCVLEQEWTEPSLVELVITSDGFVLARRTGDIGHNDFIGSVDDLERNVCALQDAAELDSEQRDEWQRLYAAKVTDWRRWRKG